MGPVGGDYLLCNLVCCRNMQATDLMLLLTFASSEADAQQKSRALANKCHIENELESESRL